MQMPHQAAPLLAKHSFQDLAKVPWKVTSLAVCCTIPTMTTAAVTTVVAAVRTACHAGQTGQK